jgi:hypothetical protein
MDSRDKWLGVSSPHLRRRRLSGPGGGSRGPGMKEGCSGENVLERER